MKGVRGGATGEGAAPVPAVKICGLTRRQDARMAVEAGADLLGVVLVDGSPRVLTAREARAVAGDLGVPVVAVVADLPRDEAVRAAVEAGADILQLHGEETPAYAAGLKGSGPWEVWKAIRVRDAEDVGRGLAAYRGSVDGLLLDGWHPRRKGGAGASFPWREVAAELRGVIPEGLRLAVAGGLDPDNVGEAVRVLAPGIVDVSSGVEERPGIKSREKVAAFIQNARRAGKEGGR